MKKVKIELDNDLFTKFIVHLQHTLKLHIYNNKMCVIYWLFIVVNLYCAN